MTIKDELHELVDQLPDAPAERALGYLRRLVKTQGAARPPQGTEGHMGPQAVSGDAFFSSPKTDLAALAAEQVVRPVADFEHLLGAFWPEDETADEFIAAVRRWRREGADG